MEARDGDVAEPGRTAAFAVGPDIAAHEGAEPSGGRDGAEAAQPSASEADGAHSQPAGDDEAAASVSTSGRRPARPDVSGGIGCSALLLPLVAVAGAVLCFFAGVLSTASGCSANGSALCSANGPWYAFALPVFVSPLIAAGTAVAAVTVRRHRSTWLAVGYGVVFISIIVGLAVASTGSG